MVDLGFTFPEGLEDVGGTLYEATSSISVLSIPLLIDELVPQLAAAADGDPSTTSRA